LPFLRIYKPKKLQAVNLNKEFFFANSQMHVGDILKRLRFDSIFRSAIENDRAFSRANPSATRPRFPP
jgi:hypothetical protein